MVDLEGETEGFYCNNLTEMLTSKSLSDLLHSDCVGGQPSRHPLLQPVRRPGLFQRDAGQG